MRGAEEAAVWRTLSLGTWQVVSAGAGMNIWRDEPCRDVAAEGVDGGGGTYRERETRESEKLRTMADDHPGKGASGEYLARCSR